MININFTRTQKSFKFDSYDDILNFIGEFIKLHYIHCSDTIVLMFDMKRR